MFTKQLLKTLFTYEDGNLIWKNPVSNKCKVGTIAGYVRPPQNYRYIGIEKKYYSAHRKFFDDLEKANEWVMKTREELHGEFFKH